MSRLAAVCHRPKPACLSPQCYDAAIAGLFSALHSRLTRWRAGLALAPKPERSLMRQALPLSAYGGTAWRSLRNYSHALFFTDIMHCKRPQVNIFAAWYAFRLTGFWLLAAR